MSPGKGRELRDSMEYGAANSGADKEYSHGGELVPEGQYPTSPEQEDSTPTEDIVPIHDKAANHEPNKLPNNIEKMMVDMMYEFKTELSAIQQRMNMMEIAMTRSYKQQESEVGVGG